MKKETVLKSELSASSGGLPSEQKYRAVLVMGGAGWGATIRVEQPIRGEWHSCSNWYLETLLGHASDGISIDYGQNWSITGGFSAAITEASIIVARAYKS